MYLVETTADVEGCFVIAFKLGVALFHVGVCFVLEVVLTLFFILPKLSAFAGVFLLLGLTILVFGLTFV